MARLAVLALLLAVSSAARTDDASIAVSRAISDTERSPTRDFDVGGYLANKTRL